MQACMVCMYACVHIGAHCWQDGVSLRGSNTDGNSVIGPVWVCRMETSRMGLSDGNPSYESVTCYIASQLRPVRPLEQVFHLLGCTRVCIYACTYMGALVCVCASGD